MDRIVTLTPPCSCRQQQWWRCWWLWQRRCRTRCLWSCSSRSGGPWPSTGTWVYRPQSFGWYQLVEEGGGLQEAGSTKADVEMVQNSPLRLDLDHEFHGHVSSAGGLWNPQCGWLEIVRIKDFPLRWRDNFVKEQYTLLLRYDLVYRQVFSACTSMYVNYINWATCWF